MPPPSRLADLTLLVVVLLIAALVVAPGTSSVVAPYRRKARIARTLGWIGVSLLWLVSTPWFANALARKVEARPPTAEALSAIDPDATALVVLSGGIRWRDPEDELPAVERLDGASFSRAVGAARLYRVQPVRVVIVSGSGPGERQTDSAEGMADVLVAFGVPRVAIHLETRSGDTKENAIFSVAKARELGCTRVALVTSALHLPRAAMEFRRAGAEVVPLPVDRVGYPEFTSSALLPFTSSLLMTHRALHELLGRLKI